MFARLREGDLFPLSSLAFYAYTCHGYYIFVIVDPLLLLLSGRGGCGERGGDILIAIELKMDCQVPLAHPLKLRCQLRCQLQRKQLQDSQKSHLQRLACDLGAPRGNRQGNIIAL